MGGSAANIVKTAKDAQEAVFTGGYSLTRGGQAATQNAENVVDTLINGPKTSQAPDLPAIPDAPSASNPGTTKSMQEAMDNERRSRGRASTYLTSASGLSTAATTASRTLLGS